MNNDQCSMMNDDGWWMMNDEWRMTNDGRWMIEYLMNYEWWMMNQEWSMMNDDCLRAISKVSQKLEYCLSTHTLTHTHIHHWTVSWHPSNFYDTSIRNTLSFGPEATTMRHPEWQMQMQMRNKLWYHKRWRSSHITFISLSQPRKPCVWGEGSSDCISNYS